MSLNAPIDSVLHKLNIHTFDAIDAAMSAKFTQMVANANDAIAKADADTNKIIAKTQATPKDTGGFGNGNDNAAALAAANALEKEHIADLKEELQISGLRKAAETELTQIAKTYNAIANDSKQPLTERIAAIQIASAAQSALNEEAKKAEDAAKKAADEANKAIEDRIELLKQDLQLDDRRAAATAELIAQEKTLAATRDNKSLPDDVRAKAAEELGRTQSALAARARQDIEAENTAWKQQVETLKEGLAFDKSRGQALTEMVSLVRQQKAIADMVTILTQPSNMPHCNATWS